METENNITVTVESDNKKLQLTISEYATVDDWINVFKTIMIHNTFMEDSVKEMFSSDEDLYDLQSEDIYDLQSEDI